MMWFTMNPYLPSDHAPITIELKPPFPCLETLLTRASDLGKHAAEYSFKVNDNKRLTKQPVKFNNVNSNKFLDNLTEQELPIHINEDVNYAALNLGNILYNCAHDSKISNNSEQVMQ